jgi:multicomponent Na+:H+ antiporter subunit G
MIASAIDIATSIMLAAGGFFAVVGAVGMLRMPDFYTRMHAASVTDTLGAGLILFGLMLQGGFTLVTVKLLVILLLMLLTGPVATHALARAAMHARLQPVLHEDRRSP